MKTGCSSSSRAKTRSGLRGAPRRGPLSAPSSPSRCHREHNEAAARARAFPSAERGFAHTHTNRTHTTARTRGRARAGQYARCAFPFADRNRVAAVNLAAYPPARLSLSLPHPLCLPLAIGTRARGSGLGVAATRY